MRPYLLFCYSVFFRLNLDIVGKVFVANKMYFHRVSRLRSILVHETCIDGFVCRLLNHYDLFDCLLSLIISEKCIVKADSHNDG